MQSDNEKFKVARFVTLNLPTGQAGSFQDHKRMLKYLPAQAGIQHDGGEHFTF